MLIIENNLMIIIISLNNITKDFLYKWSWSDKHKKKENRLGNNST